MQTCWQQGEVAQSSTSAGHTPQPGWHQCHPRARLPQHGSAHTPAHSHTHTSQTHLHTTCSVYMHTTTCIQPHAQLPAHLCTTTFRQPHAHTHLHMTVCTPACELHVLTHNHTGTEVRPWPCTHRHTRTQVATQGHPACCGSRVVTGRCWGVPTATEQMLTCHSMWALTQWLSRAAGGHGAVDARRGHDAASHQAPLYHPHPCPGPREQDWRQQEGGSHSQHQTRALPQRSSEPLAWGTAVGKEAARTDTRPLVLVQLIATGAGADRARTAVAAAVGAAAVVRLTAVHDLHLDPCGQTHQGCGTRDGVTPRAGTVLPP